MKPQNKKVIMQKKIFFLVFKYNFRSIYFNNFIKIKKIKNFRLWNLSGPLKYYLFGIFIIFFVQRFHSFFKNCTLISCDGQPILSYNAINLWFGGTSGKIPINHRKLKNNCHVFENFIKKEKNLIKLYPHNLKLIVPKKKIKIIFIGNFTLYNLGIINKIWQIEKKKIFNNCEIIEKKIFWKKYNLHNHPKIHNYYIAIKDLLRFNLIIKLKQKFKHQLVVVGNNWKPYIKSSLKSNYNSKYISSLYNGNICLDFGSKWGSNSLYPRSIEILESGGLLLQSAQSDSREIYDKHYKNISFNNLSEISSRIKTLLKNSSKIKRLYTDQSEVFSSVNSNYNTLKKIHLISKKNN
jgi:hypothetical protein